MLNITFVAVFCWIIQKSSQTIFYLEPPDCQYNHILRADDVLYVDSSHGNHTKNQMGECSIRIESINRSKHLNYQFELGPNITDCSVELLFTDGQEITSKFPVPRYTCNSLHPYRQAHADNWEGTITVRRAYATYRKDFFFRIKVNVMEPWSDHEDNGLGFYVDKSVNEPSIPLVLYIILAVDFLLPTVIFIINEWTGRYGESKSTKNATGTSVPSQTTLMNPAFPNTSSDLARYPPVHKKAAVGAERQAAFESSLAANMETSKAGEYVKFPYYKQHADPTDTPTLLKQRLSGGNNKTLSVSSGMHKELSVPLSRTASDRSPASGRSLAETDKRMNSFSERSTGLKTINSKKNQQQLRFFEGSDS